VTGEEQHQDPKRSVLTALAANAAIAVAKAVAGALSGSAAMLAEALHSIADTGNQILLLVGLRRSERPADTEHPFGYGRERYVWTFLVAVNLFALGAAFSIYNGVHGLIAGHELPDPVVALIVLALAAAFEGTALRTAWRQFQARRPPGRGVWESIRESKDPEILTVLGEDSAAISGLIVAALGIGLSEITGSAAFDAAASIGVGLILGAVAYLLGREIQRLIIGEAASPEVNRAICRIAEGSDAVTRLVELRTLHAGPDEVLVVLELVFSDELTSDDIEAAIDDIEAAIRDEVPQARRIYIEPESERPADEGAAVSSSAAGN
jgi:cation diffusion facilitator family transporter